MTPLTAISQITAGETYIVSSVIALAKDILYRKVECVAILRPKSSSGEWKRGDVIYNVGEDESWNMKIIK